MRVKPLIAATLLALAKMAGEQPIGVEFSHYFGLRALVA